MDSFVTLLDPEEEGRFYYFHAHSLHRPYVNSQGLYNTTKAMQYIGNSNNITRELHNVNLRHQFKRKYNSSKIQENFEKVLFNVTAGGIKKNFTIQDVEELHERYQRQVEYVDGAHAPLYAYLKEHFWDNSIIVFYSNHGDGLFDNGIIGHGVGYQFNSHVPLLMHHPYYESPLVIDTPVSLIDLAPSVYDILGISLDHYIGGTTFIPLIVPEEGREYDREYVFGRDFQDSYVRDRGWKLMVFGSKFMELYNLTIDPKEHTIVTQDHQEIADRLFQIHNTKKREVLNQAQLFNETHGSD